ncbi:hypothetical protein [Paramicrobacterium chengjingii]|uniref:hypothetical protein n=1 Tax=Paramicrobacterium chengjingii TaxID=2769067 RepID=UPI001420BA0A|nr:hypothetical protein [Microbacterium chengjingii]
MRQSQTAVLERGITLDDVIHTEPFETAWASEARWFVHFLEPEAAGTVAVQAQVSPNGIQWVDHESDAVTVDAPHLGTGTIRDFGGWLRFTITGDTSPLIKVVLALKE